MVHVMGTTALVMMLVPTCALGQNVAFNKTVRVSSTYTTFEGRFAVDGIVSNPSRWISDFVNATHIPYLVVDLGDVYFINEVNIWAGLGDDSTTWGLCNHAVDVYTQIATNIDVIGPFDATTNWQNLFSGSYGTLFQHSGSAIARFIRIIANQGSACAVGTNNRARIVEFGVMGELAASGAPLGGVQISDQAAGKPVMASLETTSASFAVDGDASTIWTAAADLTWLLVDLQQDTTVFRFSLQGIQTTRDQAMGICWHNISMYNGSATSNSAVSTDTDPAHWILLTQVVATTVLSVENDDIRPVRGRFFKMTMNNRACNHAATQISAFEVYGTQQTNIVGVNPGLLNVAINKPVLADSTLTNGAGTYYGSNAVDGVTDLNTLSRWISTNTDPVHWLAIDLGANFLISSISVSPDDIGSGARGVCTYQLQVWTGVSNANLQGAANSDCGWTTIYRQNDPVFITQNNNFPPIVGRMVKLIVNQTGCANTDNHARIYEVQIFGVEQANTILADGTNTSLAGSAGLVPNVALNKSAIADSVLSASYVPANAFDGDNSTTSSRWVSDDATDRHWLAVDLEGIYLIQGINLVAGYNGRDGLCTHNISVYTGLYMTLEDAVNDMSHWSVVLSQLDQVITIEHTGITPPTFGQFVMLTVDQSPCSWSNHARVYELYVYGTPAPMGTTPRAVPNAALGKTGLASTWLDEAGGYPANNAFDGVVSLASRWVSARSGDLQPWLVVDLADQYILYGASMVIGWPGSLCLTGLCSYNISVWSGPDVSLQAATASSTGWTNLIVNDQYTHDQATHDEFPPSSVGQYVRLSIDQTNCANFSGVYARDVLSGIVRVMEFRVFGEPVTQSPTAVPTVVPTMFPTTTSAPVPSQGASNSDSNDDANANLVVIVAMVAAVLVVIVGAVIYRKQSSGSTASHNDGVAFDNPMYDESSKQIAKASTMDDGEYMDVSDGVMEGAPEGEGFDEDGF